MIKDNCWNCKEEIDITKVRTGQDELKNTGMITLGNQLCDDCLREQESYPSLNDHSIYIES